MKLFKMWEMQLFVTILLSLAVSYGILSIRYSEKTYNLDGLIPYTLRSIPHSDMMRHLNEYYNTNDFSGFIYETKR